MVFGQMAEFQKKVPEIHKGMTLIVTDMVKLCLLSSDKLFLN